MGKRNFREMLLKRQKAVNSLVCVGLDPLPEKFPECIRKGYGGLDWRGLFIWMKDIIEATADYACMYKLQRAHYEAIPDGQKALQAIITHIRAHHPTIPIFLDCKRGDIGRTQQRYRIAHFEIDGADGMNFSPYMGSSCMEELIDKSNPGKAIVGLCRTSNPEAWEIQDMIQRDGRFLWQHIAEKTLRWSKEFGITENVGLVMGAAHKDPADPKKIYAEHLSLCRDIVGNDFWFLIPGVGTQGGFIKETMEHAYLGPGSIAINSSSGIIFAGSGKDFAQAARNATKELKDQINEHRQVEMIQMLHTDLFNERKIKFGFFKLKLHDKNPQAPLSPIYLNIRELPARIYGLMADILQNVAREEGLEYDYVIGIPKAGEPIGRAFAEAVGKPFLLMEKIEGKDDRRIGKILSPFDPGKKVLLIDDLITGADTKREAGDSIALQGLKVAAIVVLYDRGQGGLEQLESEWEKVIAVSKLSEALDYYVDRRKIPVAKRNKVVDYLNQNK